MTSATADALLHELPGGAILFDGDALSQAPLACFKPPAGAPRAMQADAGRGSAWFLDSPAGPAVLRHYRRGGAVARFNRDLYLWLGAESTRSFREFRLLRELRRRGLPVPQPLAARYLRCGMLGYRADLLMRRIDARGSLASLFADPAAAPGRWRALGATLARFHAAGVDHADLNAHNILFGEDGGWWLIDFDRGRLRSAGGQWWREKLQRLERSLRKLRLLRDDSRASVDAWQTVMDAHAEALAGAAQ